ncbi:MAG: hypothetical protein ACJ70Q_04135 [Nitrososphaera sp.]
MTTSRDATLGIIATTSATSTAGFADENQPPTLSVEERIKQSCHTIRNGDSQDALELLESALQQLRG